MRREPLTGNTGENFESHKPVHETTTDSCTGKSGTRGHLRDFLDRRVTDGDSFTTASEALP